MFAKLLPLLLLPVAFCAPVASAQQSGTLNPTFLPLQRLNTALLRLNNQVSFFRGDAREANALESEVAAAFNQINDLATQIGTGPELPLSEAINLYTVVPNVVLTSLSLSRNLARKSELIQDQATKARGWPLMQMAYQAVYNLDFAAQSKMPATYVNLMRIQDRNAIASMTTIRNQFTPSGAIPPSGTIPGAPFAAGVAGAAPPAQTGQIGALTLPRIGNGNLITVGLPTFGSIGSIFGRPQPRPAASPVPAPQATPAFQPEGQYSTYQPYLGSDGVQYQPVSQPTPQYQPVQPQYQPQYQPVQPQYQAPAPQPTPQGQSYDPSGYQPQGYAPAGR